jgi:formamidopyrimidine-DNA glycosylase
VPELPEVETMVRDIAPWLEGCRIEHVELKKTDVLRQVSKPRLIEALRGNTFEQVYRRAKHAVFRLSSGHRMIIQPRMTGSLLVYERLLTREETKYAVLICTLTDGRKLVYRDVRRLGTIWLLDEAGWVAYTGRIGPEPLEETFTPFTFAQRLKGTRTAVKKAIMDQRRLAGVGNIYANEALFDARLNPAKRTDRLSLEEFARLHAAGSS